LIRKGKPKEAKILLDKLFATDPENPQVKKLLTEIQDKDEVAETEVKSKDIPADYKSFSQLQEKLSPMEALNAILKVPGVLGCLIVDKSGLVTESKFKKELNSETLGVASAVVFDEIEKSVQKIYSGDMEQIIVESKEFDFWVLRFDNFLLSVFCDSKANFGYLKMRLSKVRARISI